MGKAGYVFRMLSGSRFDKLFTVIRRVRERNGKNSVSIFFDILNCAIRYGAGYNDYLIFGFYDMTPSQRKTYVTRVSNKKIISLCNDPEYDYIFDNKNVFDARFEKYLGRRYLDLAKTDFTEFEEFLQGQQVIFAKPNEGESGKGIERLKTADFADARALYDYVMRPEKNFGTVEHALQQHEAFNKLYPLAINSLRIVTIVANGKAYCAYVTAKMGNEGKFVDNMENSGLCCPVDIETGKIMGVAHTSKLIVYEKHPYTGVTLKGYQLPYIKEAVELCKQAALEVPQIKYVGWDVCVTPTGPAIIEGNNYPGYDFWQLPEHTPDKIGLLPFYKELLPQL